MGLTARDWERFEATGRVDELSTDGAEVVRRFVDWMLYTPAGDEALQHINNTKRQRFLPFDSQAEESGR